jgi:hypothetical protein
MNDLVNISTTVSTSKNVQMKISEHALFKLLKLNKNEVRNLKAYVRIPGGGDYSNMSLYLSECELIVQYETVENEMQVSKLIIE